MDKGNSGHSFSHVGKGGNEMGEYKREGRGNRKENSF